MKKLFLISFIFLASATISFAQLNVLPSGNVGVGVPVPVDKFQVDGGHISATGGDIKISGANKFSFITYGGGWYMNDVYWIKSYNNKGIYSTGTIRSDNAIQVGSVGSTFNVLNLGNLSYKTNVLFANYSTGFVGIGTASPARPLHVKGSAVYTSGTAISSFSPYIRGKNGVTTCSSPDYSWVNDSVTGIFHPAQNVIGFSTLNTERMRIDNNGNIGIGMIPGGSSKVFISGNVDCKAVFCDVYHTADWGQSMSTRVYRPLTVSYVVNYNSLDRFYVRGDGLACSETGFYTWSDSSYKKNIVTIASPLQKVLSLRGVNYNLKEETLAVANDTSTYISPDPNPLQMGLIAQEVETVIPEVVINMPNGKKAIAYQNLVGLLVEAIKEQNREIENLKARLDECCKAITPATGN